MMLVNMKIVFCFLFLLLYGFLLQQIEDTETTNGMGIMDEEFVEVSMDGVSYTENA
ncbi:hypothetical protein ACE6H2_006667 [Prunus campanulata]